MSFLEDWGDSQSQGSTEYALQLLQAAQARDRAGSAGGALPPPTVDASAPGDHGDTPSQAAFFDVLAGNSRDGLNLAFRALGGGGGAGGGADGASDGGASTTTTRSAAASAANKRDRAGGAAASASGPSPAAASSAGVAGGAGSGGDAAPARGLPGLSPDSMRPSKMPRLAGLPPPAAEGGAGGAAAAAAGAAAGSVAASRAQEGAPDADVHAAAAAHPGSATTAFSEAAGRAERVSTRAGARRTVVGERGAVNVVGLEAAASLEAQAQAQAEAEAAAVAAGSPAPQAAAGSPAVWGAPPAATTTTTTPQGETWPALGAEAHATAEAEAEALAQAEAAAAAAAAASAAAATPERSPSGAVAAAAAGEAEEERGRAPDRETDEHRLAQRQKQIDLGKSTDEYQRFLEKYPAAGARRRRARTPDKYQVCSKRTFAKQLSDWRRAVHAAVGNPTSTSSATGGAASSGRGGPRTRSQQRAQAKRGEPRRVDPFFS